MKNRILKSILHLVLVTLVVLVSEFLFNQKLSFIEIIFLYAFLSVLEILYHIQNDIKYLKSSVRMYYEEICELEENKTLRHNKIAYKLDEIILVHIPQILSYLNKDNQIDTSIPDVEDINKRSEKLRAQARTEESDSKAFGLEAKAQREDKLRAVIESGLIARIGIYYETRWDDKQICLRIQNFDKTKNVAVFYPKSNKLNFKGNWTSNASDYLEKHLKQLSDEQEM